MNKVLNFKKFGSRKAKAGISALLAGIMLLAAFSFPWTASAHCDSYQGPVVHAAQQALDTGNVKLILPYVKVEDEAQLTAAFNQARQVRSLSPEAKKLSEQYFFETAVRLHRQGEGASYTGLTNEQVPPAIVEADKALQSGSLKGVNSLLTEALNHGLAEKYQEVVDARATAKKLDTVAANRERVEAELSFEKYVFDLYTLASGGAAEH